MPKTNLSVVAPARGEIPKLVEEFVLDCRARNLSPRSIDFYERSLKILLDWCEEEGVETVAALDQHTVTKFAAWLNERPSTATGEPLSKVSVASYLRSVKLLLNWARKRQLVGERLSVPMPRQPRRDLSAEVLTKEEMHRLVLATSTKRDRALIELLCTTGLRLGEALGLTGADLIDQGREGRFVRVRHRSAGGGAKGDSVRDVPVRPSVFAQLRELVKGRPREALTEHVFVAVRKRNGEYERLTPRGVHGAIQAAAHGAGIQKRVHAHLLRHSFATVYLRDGGNPINLQRLLGHSDLTMISRVYAHPNRADAYNELMRILGRDD